MVINFSLIAPWLLLFLAHAPDRVFDYATVITMFHGIVRCAAHQPPRLSLPRQKN